MAMIPANIDQLLTRFDAAYDLADDDRISPGVFPVFEYPASHFAMQVIKVINAAGIQNFINIRVNKVLLPILMSKLPSEILELVSVDSVRIFLEYLLHYDGAKPSWFTFSQTMSKLIKPSIAVSQAVGDMSSAWPGLDPAMFRRMAWDMVRAVCQIRSNSIMQLALWICLRSISCSILMRSGLLSIRTKIYRSII